MVKSALTISMCFILLACSDNTEHAKSLVLSSLAEVRGVHFQNLENFPGNVVCGEYRNSDPMMSSSEFRRFIVVGDVANNRPSDDDWEIFCSSDPAAALQNRLGIGPLQNPETQISQVRSDLEQIGVALKEYLADNFTLPTTAQGLSALATATTTPPLPRKFRTGGYLSTIPTDPWGRPYIYERSGLGGVAEEFKLYTLGADGVAGGTGEDADVKIEHLKYLAFIDP